VTVALLAPVVGCGGSGDDRPDIAVTQPAEPPATGAPTSTEPTDTLDTAALPNPTSATPLPASGRRELETRAAEVAAAVRRWDEELAACVGRSGDGDDSDTTCTHATWEQLVDHVEVETYYFLEYLRAMPRGPCHGALAAENDTLRAFWHGAAPLDLAWLDEQQQPPSRFDSRPRSTSSDPSPVGYARPSRPFALRESGWA